jgi:peptidoglycan/xylan/chitin deacetylase (PgdA/CDA1 family)
MSREAPLPSPSAEPLTAVTYHWVRPAGASDLPKLAALGLDAFVGQLGWLAAHHTFVRPEDIAEHLGGGKALPANACVLTFDDGLRDHYVHVFPLLAERGIVGLFYAPLAVLRRERVLRVHRLQLTLASLRTAELLTRARRALAARGLDVEANARARYVHRSRWDDPETGFVKWLLSSWLDLETSEAVIGDLFGELFDDTALAARLYLSLDEAREMARAGMHFGGHGDAHYRLDEAPEAIVRRELEASLTAVTLVHGTAGLRTFAHPYGGYRESSVGELERLGFAFAWGTAGGARVGEPGARMRLRRQDTNDFPQPSGPVP